MPTSRNSSSASSPCRIDWRPSCAAATCLRVLGVAAALALLLSDLAWPIAAPVAVLACIRGAWLARQWAKKPPRRLLWPAHGAVLLDGEPIDAPRLHWRGPWLFLHWRKQGRAHALAWWPDTLDAAARRELRLRAGAGDVSRLPPSVAT